MTSDTHEMTHDELMSLPVAVSLDTANRALGTGRTNGYALAKRGRYPVRVPRHGRQYKVRRYDLHRHLGVSVEAVGRDVDDAA